MYVCTYSYVSNTLLTFLSRLPVYTKQTMYIHVIFATPPPPPPKKIDFLPHPPSLQRPSPVENNVKPHFLKIVSFSNCSYVKGIRCVREEMAEKMAK